MTWNTLIYTRPTLMLQRLLASAVAVLLLASTAQAQGQAGELEQSGTSYHSFVRSGELTVEVLVLGTGSDGVYEVGLDTPLDQLLALAGGAQVTSDALDEVTLRLFRQEEGGRSLIYEAPLERMLKEPGQYPALQDGDVFVMETPGESGERFTWRDAVSIVSSVASLTLVAVRLFSGSF